MVSDLFELTEHDNNWWAVMWPEDKWVGVNDPQTKLKLVELVLGSLKSIEVGFAVKQKDYGIYNTLYVNSSVFYDSRNIAMMLDRYNVGGVKFPTKAEAEHFIDVLEKKLMWKVLKE